jgi:hypothetical protein
MQQMHQGHVPGATGASANDPATAASIDELISSAAKQADSAVADKAAEPAPASEKKGKKGKEKATVKLVYSDDMVSPEEKMAQLPRYAAEPKPPQTVMDEILEGTVTGTVRGPDDVQDPMP